MTRPSSQKAKRHRAAIEFVQSGLDHYRHGRIAEAGAALLAALEVDAGCFDALHMLSLVRHAEGRNAEAITLIDKALRVNRGSADALANRGAILHSLGRYDEALKSCERALVLAPRHLNALNNRANALERLGRLSESLASYDKALVLEPRSVLALVNRANPLQRLHRFEEALANCEQALAIAPRNVQALVNRANALQRLHRLDAAVANYDAALAINPDHAGAWTNRGTVLETLGRVDDALASHERATALDPRSAAAWSNRGNALMMLGRHEEALASIDAALALEAPYTAAWRHRGNVLCELGRYAEARASYRQAYTPSRPDNGGVEFAEGLLSLLEGDFGAGWAKYESRWRTLQSPENPLAARAPQWTGDEPLAGRTILLHSDGGLGDAIQFVRYVPLVAERASRVLLTIQPTLATLQLPVAENVSIITHDREIPAFDLQCPLSSLPLAFGIGLTNIVGAPYISAPPARRAAWAQRLPQSGKRIGFVWAGNAVHRRDRLRSIALPLLAPLFRVPNIACISLQRDLRPGDDAFLREANCAHVGDALGDFADTAAIISELDVIVTIDSSVAHLAGAIGRPVWILLPFHPDWRWLLGREDSPWYSSARLFRQPAVGDWASVIERVRVALHTG